MAKTTAEINAEAREVVRARLRERGYDDMADRASDDRIDRLMETQIERVGIAARQVGDEILASFRRFTTRASRALARD